MTTTQTETFDSTKDALLSMLREDTGRHMLDSGDHYGRHHEENQTRDITGEPPVTVDYSFGDILPSISTFHFLKDRLDYAPNVDTTLQEFLSERDVSHLAGMEAFAESEAFALDTGTPIDEIGGLYGEGDPMTVNTYNGECALDQTIQFVFVEAGGEAFVLLQIHGGCDVRGGYTRPRAFRVDAFDAAEMFDYARVTIHDPEANVHWDTDNAGYYWYENGLTAGANLEEYPMIEAEEIDGDPAGYAVENETIVVTGRNTALSPLTGAELEAYI